MRTLCDGLYARLSARPAAEQADTFDEIQPPCMTRLIYAAGSREHRTNKSRPQGAQVWV